MAHLTNFAEVEKFLEVYTPPARSMRGNYNLDNMRRLMAHLGDPQDSYKVIHVAGTSGKTSTSYYIASLLGQTDKKIGLTVSPHVDSLNERLQFNLIPLAEAEYCAEFSEFIKLLAELNFKPTYFEILVAFAFWEFERQHVDFAVVEVGLGGLLDGTNIVNRNDKVSVITDIGLDHQNVLGHEISQIAYQKAGIILPKSDAFCLSQSSEIINVFQKQAEKVDARLHIGEQQVPEFAKTLPLYQQRNWCLALQVSSFVIGREGLDHISLDQKQVSLKTYIPARMEIIKTNGKTIILDAAHNPQKMQALVPTLQEKFPGQKFVVILALLKSQDFRVEGALSELKPITKSLILTSFIGNQDLRKISTEPEKIKQSAANMGFSEIEVIPDSDKAISKIMSLSEGQYLITGSLYLIHHVHSKIPR